MTTYTVKYFPVKALAEGIRLLLAYGDDKFEDIHILQEQWPNIKPTVPFGALPVLEFDGKSYPQSVAISRYLGRKNGLAGENALEDLDIDVVMDAVTDFRQKCGAAYYEEDEAIKAKKYVDINENVIPLFLERLDAIAAANDGHLALGKLTWVDFYFAGAYDYLKRIAAIDIGEKAPNLKKVVDNVLALPAVSAYYETATKLEF